MGSVPHPFCVKGKELAMTEEYIMMQDMIQEHKERMDHLKKYYPFFKLADNDLMMWKEGKYSCLDMGYITLAVLRFFIDENSLKDKDVRYVEYEQFLHSVFVRDFQMELTKEEEKELCSYLFDKLLNEGKPFSFHYYDPKDHQKKSFRVKLLESKIVDSELYYYITPDAIEFYLDTKEIKEESSISVEQLLLSKLIAAQNFRGGIEVVKRINREVLKLKLKKNQILNLLSVDVFEGKQAYESYVGEITKWFQEEQRLFKKNTDLIAKALAKAESGRQGSENSHFYSILNDIYILEVELRKAMYQHSELLSLCTSMQQNVDDIVKKSKLSTLRNAFDFHHAMGRMMEQDNVDALEHLMIPLFGIKLKKNFNLFQIEDMIHLKAENDEDLELVSEGMEEDYIFEDELEEQRINNNFDAIAKVLLEFLLTRESFSLREFNSELKKVLGEGVLVNGDYYTFLIHMCQKEEYDVEEMKKKPETFFEEIIYKLLIRKTTYDGLAFRLVRKGEDTVKITDMLEISDIQFEKVDREWKREI